MSFEKFSIKVAVRNPEGLGVQTFMETFGEWIQNKTVPGTMIDCADYTHMKDGPGVILVTHEANWGLDEQDGYVGLYYSVKIKQSGSNAEKLKDAFKTVFLGCDAIEKNSRHKGLEFNSQFLEIMLNDRFSAANNEGNQKLLQEDVAAFLKNELNVEASITAEADLKKRLAVRVQMSESLTPSEVLEKLK